VRVLIIAGGPKIRRRVFGLSAFGGKMARKTLFLYGSNVNLGWRVVRMISLDEGLRREARGTYRRVYDGMTNALLGFQLVETVRGDQDAIRSQHTPAAISAAEMQTNAGLDGKSLTAGLPEDLRLERKVPEDHVERVQEKVRVYPFIKPKSTPIVRRVAAAICDQAQQLIEDGELLDEACACA
jgi:hypothetical protein